jgi:hypothetical protein
MNIKEYWAKLVASGLAPNDRWVMAIYNEYSRSWCIHESDRKSIYLWVGNEIAHAGNPNEEILLRKDGVDLYKPEWQKPTEADIGKMCWFYTFRDGIILCELKSVLKEGAFIANQTISFNYTKCLLANNGRLTPTVENFEEAYR